MTPLKNQYSSVKPYTRDQSGCPRNDTRNHNCSYPKWLYVNQRGMKPRRYSLVTHHGLRQWLRPPKCCVASTLRLLGRVSRTPRRSVRLQRWQLSTISFDAEGAGSLCRSVEPRQVRVRAQGIYRPIGLGVMHPVISIVEAGQQRYASALGRGSLVY